MMNQIDIALLIYFVILLFFMLKCRIEAGKINKEINQESGVENE